MRTNHARRTAPSDWTSLEQLTLLCASNSHHLLYPSALTEEILLCLARDLRLIDRFASSDEDHDVPLAPSMYVVLQLLMRPGIKHRGSGRFQMDEEGLEKAVKVLQCAVEREIVSRIVGITSDTNEDELFLAELDQVDFYD